MFDVKLLLRRYDPTLVRDRYKSAVSDDKTKGR